MPVRQRRRVVVKTSAYTVNPAVDGGGTLFVAKGSGSLTFTLPAPTEALLGEFYDFLNAVDQDMVIATATADTLVTDGDLAADSVSFATSSHKIGGKARLQCIPGATSGYRWAATNASGCTMTVTS